MLDTFRTKTAFDAFRHRKHAPTTPALALVPEFQIQRYHIAPDQPAMKPLESLKRLAGPVNLGFPSTKEFIVLDDADVTVVFRVAWPDQQRDKMHVAIIAFLNPIRVPRIRLFADQRERRIASRNELPDRRNISKRPAMIMCLRFQTFPPPDLCTIP